MIIAVYCEKGEDTGYALTAMARQMAPEASVAVVAEGEDTAGRALESGADDAYVLPVFPDFCRQGSAIAQTVKRLSPDIVLFPATLRGRFLSSWVAAKLQTGLTADCTKLSLTEEGILLQTRPAYGGNRLAEIVCRERRPQMASVRPGIYPVPETVSIPAKKPVPVTLDALPDFVTLMEETRQQQGVSLQKAKVIIAGGRGIGGKEGFEVLHTLAEAMGGTVGASRSAVDAGYISYAHQIGQTGAIVRPALYIAFGISGMIQHVVGMRSSGIVVAVNTDERAPVFRVADYGIVADWRETAEEMIKIIKERKQ